MFKHSVIDYVKYAKHLSWKKWTSSDSLARQRYNSCILSRIAVMSSSLVHNKFKIPFQIQKMVYFFLKLIQFLFMLRYNENILFTLTICFYSNSANNSLNFDVGNYGNVGTCNSCVVTKVRVFLHWRLSAHGLFIMSNIFRTTLGDGVQNFMKKITITVSTLLSNTRFS